TLQWSRRGFHGRPHRSPVTILEQRLGDGVFGIVLEDHPVQPLAEGHAGPAGQILGDLAGLRIDPLHAPGRPRRHIESSPTPASTLSTDSWGVNATKTQDIASTVITCG